MSKIGKVLSESRVVFSKIDDIVSKVFLYYAAIGGFVFGWFSLAVILFTLAGEIPLIFVLILRVFYFLATFLLGLKVSIFVVGKFRKKENRDIN